MNMVKWEVTILIVQMVGLDLTLVILVLLVQKTLLMF